MAETLSPRDQGLKGRAVEEVWRHLDNPVTLNMKEMARIAKRPILTMILARPDGTCQTIVSEITDGDVVKNHLEVMWNQVAK